MVRTKNLSLAAASWKGAQKLYTLLLWIEEHTISVALMVMVASIFLQVVYRYVLSQTLIWSEELSRYLMIFLTFIGAALGIERETHIRVSLLGVFKLSRGQLKVIEALMDFCGLVVCLILTSLIYQLYKDVIEFGHRSPAMELPMLYPFGAMFIGSLLMIFHFTINLLKNVLSFTKG